MPYNEKQKESTMKYLKKLKEVRFRVKQEEYDHYQQALDKSDYTSMRQFIMAAIDEKIKRDSL